MWYRKTVSMDTKIDPRAPTIDLTPDPAAHFRIMARLADGASPNNYVSVELRRFADIMERCFVTWDAWNLFLNTCKQIGAESKR